MIIYLLAAEKIVQHLDYDEIKRKKIFQKFIQEEFSRKNKSPQNNRKEGRSKSSEPLHTYLRMNTISEESASHNNLTPQRLGSRKNLQHPRGLSEESGKKKQSTNKQRNQYNQYNEDDNEYYDEPNHHHHHPNQPPYQRGGQQNFSPPHHNNNNRQDQYQQDDYQSYNPYLSNRQITKSRSPPQKMNSNRTGGYDQSASQEFQRSQEFAQNGSNKRINSQSPAGKSQSIHVDNFNRRHPIKDQQQHEEEELVGYSQLVPADNHFQSYQGQRQSGYDNDSYYQNQRMGTSQSQARLDQYQNQPPYARDNRWYEGEYPPYDNNNYPRSNGRNNSRGNKGRREQMIYRQDNYPTNGNYDLQEERLHALEQRCADYELQIQRITHNFDDFKQQAFKDNQTNKSSMLNYEETIQNLQERLYDLQAREDALKQENEKFKQKISHEQLVRTKLEEDNREVTSQLEESKDQVNEARRENMRKEDEIMHLKTQIESQKQKVYQTQIQQDIIINQLRDEKDQLTREIQGSQSNNRSIVELQDKQSGIINENKRLYNEIDEMKRQIQEMNFFIEQQKQDIYTTKHQIIEKAQRESQLHQQLENSYSEILQLKGLLQRAEMQLMNKQDIGQPPFVQPIPYGGGNIQDLSLSYQFKQVHQQEQNKRLQQQNNRNQTNNSFINEQQGNTKQRLSNERLYSQNSPQNNKMNLNDSKGRLQTQKNMTTAFNFGQDNIQDSPIDKRKQIQNRNNQQPFPDAKQISLENNLISQQLKNKNINTPSNFLAWEVPDQHPQGRQNTVRGSGGNQQQGNTNDPNSRQQQQQQQQQYSNPQQNQDQVERMYKNVKTQLDRDQEYVSQQYRMQNNSQQQQQPIKQNDRNFNTNERNLNNEYSHLYNDYINDKFKGSPEQTNKRQNQGTEPPRVQIDPKLAINNIENNLMMLNVEKDKLKNELQRLEEAKLKSAQNIRRKNDINHELNLIEGNISTQKTKLREMNVLHPY